MTTQDTNDLVRERDLLEFAIRTIGRIIRKDNQDSPQKEKMILEIMAIIDNNNLDHNEKQDQINRIKNL